MKIALMSDLHLGFHQDGGKEFLKNLDIPKCDLTILAGDLSEARHWRWKRNVKEICKKSKQVLYVLGNHEYYGSSIVEVDCLAHGLAESFPNLIVASRAKLLTRQDVPALGNQSLLAGTLWFPDNYDQAQYKHLLSDFSYIDNIEPEIYQRNNRFDVLLHGIKDDPCIIVSHHAPSNQSVDPKYAGEALNRFFVGGNFDNIIGTSKIKIWLHGHMHDPVDYMVSNTRIVSNPFGYPKDISPYWQVKIVEV